MAKLLVKDKKGVEREMEERSFQLAGSKRGFQVVRKIEAPKSEIQKLMDQKIAERAAQQAEKNSLPLGPTSDIPKTDAKQEVKEKAKPGPKPKTV